MCFWGARYIVEAYDFSGLISLPCSCSVFELTTSGGQEGEVCIVGLQSGAISSRFLPGLLSDMTVSNMYCTSPLAADP